MRSLGRRNPVVQGILPLKILITGGFRWLDLAWVRWPDISRVKGCTSRDCRVKGCASHDRFCVKAFGLHDRFGVMVRCWGTDVSEEAASRVLTTVVDAGEGAYSRHPFVARSSDEGSRRSVVSTNSTPRALNSGKYSRAKAPSLPKRCTS